MCVIEEESLSFSNRNKLLLHEAEGYCIAFVHFFHPHIRYTYSVADSFCSLLIKKKLYSIKYICIMYNVYIVFITI